MNIDILQADYKNNEISAKAFLSEFLHQFSPLILKSNVKLGVPIEGRVKEWSSIAEKIDRKLLSLSSCRDLPDFVGVRAITLFVRDAESLCQLIEETFPIEAKENKADGLDEGHFGYLSRHFLVTIPQSWKTVPTFVGLDYQVEIQVRTLSQHIWAAASHVLQYKKESDVPKAVGRSIHRVAALLETVDLEFERVLQERHDYIKSEKATAASTALDADNLKVVLDQSLPLSNKSGDEDYSDLLADLLLFDIRTIKDLRELIRTQLDQAIAEDKRYIERANVSENLSGTTRKRMSEGVYFTHVGLARQMLWGRFGKKWKNYMSKRTSEWGDDDDDDDE
jgi:putative GTP pyrophosphokinase